MRSFLGCYIPGTTEGSDGVSQPATSSLGTSERCFESEDGELIDDQLLIKQALELSERGYEDNAATIVAKL